MTALLDEVLAALTDAVLARHLFSSLGAPAGHGSLTASLFGLAVLSHLAGHAAATVAGRMVRGESGQNGMPGGTGMTHGGTRARGEIGATETRDRAMLLVLWLTPGLLLGIPVVMAVERIGFAGALIYLFTWLVCSARGVASVTHLRSSDSVKGDLVWGIALLTLVALIRRDMGTAIALDVLWFLLLSSASLVLKRRREVAERVGAQESLPWIVGGAAFVCVALVVVLTAYAAGPGGFGAILGVLGTCWRYFTVILGYALVPIAYLLGWLIEILRRLASGRRTDAPEMEGSFADELAKQLEEAGRLAQIPPWLKWGASVLALVSAGAIAWLLVSRFHHADKAVARETRVSLTRGDVVAQWLGDVADGLKELASRAGSRLFSLVGREPKTLEGIYAATLEFLARRGVSREPQMTPLEYRDAASLRIPVDEARAALGEITDVFTECHYSERPRLPQDLQAASAAYRKLVSSPFRVASTDS